MKLLIIDDEELIRRSLRRAFEIKSHQVFEAEDGSKGIKAWQKTDPDLVILDVLMPGLTGPQILKELGSSIRAKVILVSAYSGEYDLKKAKNLGANLFIPKPFQDIFELVDQAENLLLNK